MNHLLPGNIFGPATNYSRKAKKHAARETVLKRQRGFREYFLFLFLMKNAGTFVARSIEGLLKYVSSDFFFSPPRGPQHKEVGILSFDGHTQARIC